MILFTNFALFKNILKAVVLSTCLMTFLISVPLIWPISYLTRCLLVLIASFDDDYGEIVSDMGIFTEEDFINNPPKASIVITMTLEGDDDLSYQELSRLFSKHVLDATLPLPSTKKRYPELKQYISKRWGFRIWKNEMDFRLAEHIQEKYTTDYRKLDIAKIHQELLNKPFRKRRSPWELILFRSNREGHSPPHLRISKGNHFILAMRMHQSMADATSIIKLLVECLGQKKLKNTSHLVVADESKTKKILFCLMFPLNFANYMGKILLWTAKCHGHPWKTFMRNVDDDDNMEDPTSDDVPLLVRPSPKISLKKVKQLARQRQVMEESVILSIIAGAIGKYDLRGSEIFLMLSQQHEGVLMIHTINTIASDHHNLGATTRLTQCHEILQEMKRRDWARYMDILKFLCGQMFHPWRKILCRNHYWPLAVTNIGGGLERFMVGKMPCTKVIMSAGTLVGCCGVTFSTVSYRDTIRISVVAKETVLSSERMSQIGEEIRKEMNALIREMDD